MRISGSHCNPIFWITPLITPSLSATTDSYLRKKREERDVEGKEGDEGKKKDEKIIKKRWKWRVEGA